MHLESFTDKEKKVITFKDSRFYQCLDDVDYYVPSSTSILNVVPKNQQFYNFLKNRGADADTYMMERMERGSLVHKFTEIFDTTGSINLSKDSGDVDLTMDVVEMFNRYLDFSKKFKPDYNVKKLDMPGIELSMALRSLGYGGTLDRLARMRSYTCLIDIKTGNEYEYYDYQLASYVELLWKCYKIKVDKVFILYLDTQHRTEGDMQGVGWCLKEVKNVKDAYKWFVHYKKTYEKKVDVQIKNQTRFFNLNYKKTW